MWTRAKKIYREADRRRFGLGTDAANASRTHGQLSPRPRDLL
jgi:hypothetical protein